MFPSGRDNEDADKNPWLTVVEKKKKGRRAEREQRHQTPPLERIAIARQGVGGASRRRLDLKRDIWERRQESERNRAEKTGAGTSIPQASHAETVAVQTAGNVMWSGAGALEYRQAQPQRTVRTTSRWTLLFEQLVRERRENGIPEETTRIQDYYRALAERGASSSAEKQR